MDLKEFLEKKGKTMFDGSKPIEWDRVKGDKWTMGLDKKRWVEIEQLGLYLWERGGKTYVKSYIIPFGWVLEKYIRQAETIDSYSKRTQDFLDCLACLGEDKVKKLIKEME